MKIRQATKILKKGMDAEIRESTFQRAIRRDLRSLSLAYRLDFKKSVIVRDAEGNYCETTEFEGLESHLIAMHGCTLVTDPAERRKAFDILHRFEIAEPS